MSRSELRMIVGVALAAVAVQALAMAGVARMRGSATSYAFQSPDSGEYVALARGLARQGRYVPLDTDGRSLGGPDAWRTPGYPLVLAVVIRLVGDGTWTLLLLQQVLGVVSIVLFWQLIRRFRRDGWAIVATIAWCVDPFRVYYGLWLLAETLFLVVLLAGAIVWAGGRSRGWSRRRALLLGGLAGAAVLVRPIGILLPVLAVIGVAWATRRTFLTRGAAIVLCCLAGSAVILGPWLVRNRLVTGHLSLTHQSGASLAYHKVVDVVLWSEGRSRFRFDPDVLAEVRDRIDECLQERWAERHGPLTEIQREELIWKKLNFGQAMRIDPFEASSMLWSVGTQELCERKGAMVACFMAQGAGMLAFPLGLVVTPPAGSGSAPLSMLIGREGTFIATALPVVLGSAYAILALVAAGRLLAGVVRRRGQATWFAFWPAASLFVLALPFEDPRFRLPLVPLMWLTAVAREPSPPATERDSFATEVAEAAERKKKVITE